MFPRAVHTSAPWRLTSILSVAFVSGCYDDSSSANTVDPKAPFALDILTVRDCPPPAHETLAPGERLVGVEVEVHAQEKGVPANFYYGRLMGAEGKSYRPTFSGCVPRLTAPPLDMGTRKRGFVNFKVPSSATGLMFSYAPRLAGADPGPANSVELPLGR
jgi:hypothetical protein